MLHRPNTDKKPENPKLNPNPNPNGGPIPMPNYIMLHYGNYKCLLYSISHWDIKFHSSWLILYTQGVPTNVAPTISC